MSKSKVISSYIWKFLERFIVQIAGFVTTLVLARLLTPDDYGVVALVMVFIELATVFVQGGFNTALIRKEQMDEADLSTVFYFSLAVAALCYAVIYVCAPLISGFYKKEIIAPVIRVLALTLFPGAFNSIQVAVATRKLEFQKIFVAGLVSAIASAAIGVILALMGAGVWAIVAWQLTNLTVATAVMLVTTKWRPGLKFSRRKLAEMVPFGSKILASNLMVALFQNIRSLLIGTMYSTTDLAYFNRGRQFPQVVMEGINGSIQSVSLPVFAKFQSQSREVLKEEVRKVATASYLFIFPVLVGLTVVAEPLILLLLTDKWLPAVPFLRIFALACAVQPTQIICAEAIKAIGLSGVTLRLEIWRKTLEIGLLMAALRLGTQAIALSALAAGGLAILVCLYPNNKHLKYSYREQFADIGGALAASIAMGVVMWLVGLLPLGLIAGFALQILAGVLVYFYICLVFKVKGFSKFLQLGTSVIKRARSASRRFINI